MRTSTPVAVRTAEQEGAVRGLFASTPCFVISGYFGVVNVGDEAICRSVIHGIRSLYPKCRIDVITASASRSREFGLNDAGLIEGFYLTAAFWKNLAKIVVAVKRADVCIIGGGGILQDVHSWKSTCRHLTIASVALVLGRAVVAIGLGVGPLKRRWLRPLVGGVCSCFVRIQVRDRASLDALTACRVLLDRIVVTADPVVAMVGLSPRVGRNRAPDPRHPRIALALRRWPGLDHRAVAQTIEMMVDEGHEICLLCYEPEPDEAF